MNDNAPDLRQLNLVVADMPAFRLRHALRLLDDPGDPAVLGTIEEHLAHL